MNISKTVYPDQKLSENEWMKAYKVSTQVTKYDGLERAKQIMRTWNQPLLRPKPKRNFLQKLTRLFSVDY